MSAFWEFMFSLGFSYSLTIVALGTFIIGFLSGILSVFFVSQRRSILGDTIAHASLPGVIIFFLFTFQKNRTLLLIGALLSAILSVVLVVVIFQSSKLKEDVAIGVVLSFFFSLGIAILTYIQSLPHVTQAGLDNFIFGNVAFLLISDVYTLGILTLVILSILLIFWKEYKLILFDREFAIILGIQVNKLELLMVFLVSFAVVLGIEAIGVVLIAGLIIAPSVAARQWSNNYNKVTIIAGFIGGISGVIGTVISSKFDNFPTGPTVIVILFLLMSFSLLFGRKNGLLINWVHTRIFHRRVDHQLLFSQLLKLTNNFSKSQGLSKPEFSMKEYPNLEKDVLDILNICGYCKWITDERCTLTLKGIKAAKNIMIKGETK